MLTTPPSDRVRTTLLEVRRISLLLRRTFPNRKIMNLNNLRIALMFGLILMAGSCDIRTSRLIREVNFLMDSLRREHFDDTRTEYWDLNLHGDNGSYSVRGELVSRAAYEALDSALSRNFPDVMNQVVLLTDEKVTPLVNGLVNNSVIHLRREPSSRTEMVTQAMLGRPVRVLKERDGKALIQIPQGYLGWVNLPEVHQVDQQGLARYREAPKVIFTEQYGMAYSEPGEGSLPVADLVLGCILETDSVSGEYLRIRYPDGRPGWVRRNQTIPAENVFFREAEGEGLVETAQMFHGIPYLWGGTSIKAIDCSGLTSNVYFMNGIQLPRDADQQTEVGREITTRFTPEGLEPGDLLFFGRRASGDDPESVTHVAMYMGDAKYIHSAGYRERVSINSMDSTQEHYIEHYPEIFIRAVRVLDDAAEYEWAISRNRMLQQIISSTP